MTPLVSVVVPLHNKEGEVRRAIDSVLDQSVRDFELIVIDDGSTDAGPRIVGTYRDPRIRLVSQANAGVSATRNRGIESANTGLIAFLDADDEWQPEFLATILDLARKFPGCSVFATSYWIASRNGIARRAVLRGLPQDFVEGMLDDYFTVASRSDPPIWSSAIAIRRDAILAVGGFPVGIATGEDLLTWAKLAIRYRIAYSVSPLATFWEPEEISSRPGRVPETPDRVGAELAQLLDLYGSSVPGLADYVAHWHRMRGVIYLRLADGPSARSEFATALRIGSMHFKLAGLFLASLLPGRSGCLLYETLKHLLASVTRLDHKASSADSKKAKASG